MNKLKAIRKYLSSNLTTISIFIFIVFFAAMLRFYQIDKLSLWFDEIWSVQMANYDFGSFLKWISQNDINMSLFHLLLWFWVRIFPDISVEMLRILPAIFSILCIPVMFVLGKAMAIDRGKVNLVGLLAAFFVSINAYHIQYAQELRAYSLVFLLTTLSTYFLIKAIEKPSSRLMWFAYVIVITASIYSHLFAVFILIAHVASLWVLLRNKKYKFPYKNLFLSLVSVLIILIPLMFMVFGQAKTTIVWVPLPTLNFILFFFVEIAGNQGFALLILYLLLAAIGFFTQVSLVIKQKDVFAKWKVILTAFCLLFPILLSLLISIIKPIFWDRYLLITMPYLVILAANGMSSILSLKGWSNRNYLAIALLIIFILLSVLGIRDYFSNYKKTDFRGAAMFMSTQCKNSLRVYYPYWIGNKISFYNYRLRSQLFWLSATGNQLNFGQVISNLKNKYSSVCLVDSSFNVYQKPKNQNILEMQSYFSKQYPKSNESQYYQLKILYYSK